MAAAPGRSVQVRGLAQVSPQPLPEYPVAGVGDTSLSGVVTGQATVGPGADGEPGGVDDPEVRWLLEAGIFASAPRFRSIEGHQAGGPRALE